MNSGDRDRLKTYVVLLTHEIGRAVSEGMAEKAWFWAIEAYLNDAIFAQCRSEPDRRVVGVLSEDLIRLALALRRYAALALRRYAGGSTAVRARPYERGAQNTRWRQMPINLCEKETDIVHVPADHAPPEIP
ncbi:hypothetical protein CK215_25960 [Mesorhizobium sp. WSM3864]|nr:hypothetical protein CK215_25960 [Mesorhizobium sp. WSM3864]